MPKLLKKHHDRSLTVPDMPSWWSETTGLKMWPQVMREASDFSGVLAHESLKSRNPGAHPFLSRQSGSHVSPNN